MVVQRLTKDTVLRIIETSSTLSLNEARSTLGIGLPVCGLHVNGLLTLVRFLVKLLAASILLELYQELFVGEPVHFPDIEGSTGLPYEHLLERHSFKQ